MLSTGTRRIMISRRTCPSSGTAQGPRPFLTDMVVNPIFGTFGRYVLKEAMRLYEKTLAVPRGLVGQRGAAPRPRDAGARAGAVARDAEPRGRAAGWKRGDEVPGGTLHYFARASRRTRVRVADPSLGKSNKCSRL